MVITTNRLFRKTSFNAIIILVFFGEINDERAIYAYWQ